MNRFAVLLVPILLGGTPLIASADDSQINGYRLDLLDQRGYFTPPFKTAVHDLVDARQALRRAQTTEAVSRHDIPALTKQAAAIDAATSKLRAELARYAHPEDGDYEALQVALKNPAVGLADRLVMAQSFVWSYPSDPRQVEAATDLQEIVKQLANQRASLQETAAARQAARALILQRAKAHELSLAEWQVFLQDASQEELLQELGEPQTRGEDYWIYSGNWTFDSGSNSRTGLRIDFNGTRVLSVAASPP